MTTNEPDRPKTPTEPVKQIGYLVRDLAPAREQYSVLGVGHWTSFSAEPGGSYLGTPSSGALEIALGMAGTVQIELIEAVGSGTSIWHSDRDAARFGLHHVATWRPDFSEAMADLCAAGGTVVQEGDSGLAKFAYLRFSEDFLLEVLELTPTAAEFMDAIAAGQADAT